MRTLLYRHFNSLQCESFCLHSLFLVVKWIYQKESWKSDMTIGDKIKKIRTFRNMTQAELGAALGWGDKGANRLAQYETNYRVPRKDLVTEMAKILDVNPLALHEPTTMDASELMEILFWIDEFNPAAINLFQLETYPIEKCNSNEDTAVRYHDSDNWPAHPPVGLWFNYGVLNDFMKEWIIRKEELNLVQLPEMNILNGKSTGRRPVMVVENMNLRKNGEYSKYNAPQNWKIFQ